MESLGINPVLLIAQVISFSILFFVMKKFLYGYIQKALEDRRNNIKKTFTDREELEKRLKTLENEQEEKRKEMQALTKKLHTEAKNAAEEIKREIVAKAVADGERELAKAKERIAQEAVLARKGLANETKAIAQSIVEKILSEQSSDKKWQKTELNKSLKAIRQK